MLPHTGGHEWQIVEKVKHVIGSCVLHNYALLDKIGYLYQPSLYGYDDVIMSHRTHLAGFYSCFLPHINIDHIDDGQTPYQDWKHKHSGEVTQQVIILVHEGVIITSSILSASLILDISTFATKVIDVNFKPLRSTMIK